MKKKRASAKRITELAEKIEVQRRRAARPALPVNVHAQVTKTRRERVERQARKARQQRAWEQD